MACDPYLTITAEHRGGRLVLRLAGELDVANSDQLRRAVGAVLERRDPRFLTIDLAGLRFTDCAGLSVMVWAHERQASRGHRLTLTGAQPAVLRLLRLTGLDAHLDLGGEPAP